MNILNDINTLEIYNSKAVSTHHAVYHITKVLIIRETFLLHIIQLP